MITRDNYSWFVGYLIQFNDPVIRYGPFETLESILMDSSLTPQSDDYIIRVSRTGRFFLRFLYSKYRWRDMDTIEYIPSESNIKLIYLK